MDAEIARVTDLAREGASLHAERRLREAADCFREAATLARRDSIATMTKLPLILQRLGTILVDLAQYDEARQFLNEALAAVEKLLGADSPDGRSIRGSLAAIALNEGRYEEAHDALRTALKSCREAFPVDRLELARILGNLARACAFLDRKPEAEAHIAEAYRIAAPQVDDDDPLLAEIYHKLALSHREAKRLGPALYFFHRTRKSTVAVFGPESLEHAWACLETARLLADMLRYPEAIELAGQACRIRVAAVGERHPHTVEAVRALGLLLGQRGDVQAASAQLLAAHKMAVATHGQWAAETMTILLDVFSVAWQTSTERDNVEADLKNIIPILRRMNHSDTLVLPRCLTDLAGLLESKGSHAEARLLAIEAADAALQHPIDQDGEAKSTLEPLADLLLVLEEVGRGMQLLERAVKCDDWLIAQAIATRDDFQRRFYLRRLSTGVAKFIRAALQYRLCDEPTVAAAAYSLVANRKGLMAEAHMSHDDARLVVEQPELAQLINWLQDLKNQLAEVQMAGSSRGVHELLIETDRLKRRIGAIDLEIEAKTRPELRATRRSNGSADVDVVRGVIEGGAALIDIYAVPGLPQSAQEKEKREALERSGADAWLLPIRPERYVAFIVRRDTTVRMIDLGEGGGIDRLAYSYLVAMNQGRADIVPRDFEDELDTEPEEELSRGLRRKVFDPVREAIGNARSVLIAPDGATCRVPVASLLEDNGGRLMDHLDIGYITDARAMLRFGAATPAGTEPLVMVDPDYDLVKDLSVYRPKDAEMAKYSFYFPRLAGSADEGWRVAHLLNTRPVRGTKATASALAACRSPAVLHVATHGFYVRPFGQGIMVIGDVRHSKFGTFVRGHLLGYAENPFLRSGLAFAGVNGWSANAVLPAEAGDGLVSAAAAAHLNLAGTELVVLSACSTALGDVHPGEGVAGLLQGLQRAGARTVVAALWQIPDEATASLMETFYRALLQEPRPSPGAALKLAQNKLRADGKPAWQWAAYVCYGEPAPLRYLPGRASP